MSKQSHTQIGLFIAAALLAGIPFSLLVTAGHALAQGPAGVGAAEVAKEDAHSLNPLKWNKKDPKDNPDDRSASEKKLTPNLQTAGVLPANTTATEACAPFTALVTCVAALHASHDLGLDFICLRADMTGVHTTADVSACKFPDEGKTHALENTIHRMKPDVSAKRAASDAEHRAQDDLKGIGG